jgi:hypothetical protein
MTSQIPTATVPLFRSIRAALYGASAAMVLMTLLAAGIGALSARWLGALVDELATRTVPLLQATQRLAQAETEIAATAPSVLSSRSSAAIRAVREALEPSQMTLDEGIAALATMPGITARAAGLAETNKAVRTLLDHIMELQQRRLQAAAARVAAVAGVAAAHHDLAGAGAGAG